MGLFSRATMLATMGLVVALLAPAAMSSRPPLLSIANNDVQLPAGTSYDFHSETCPNLENMVRVAVEDAMESDVGVLAGLLRITFNDCFPQGCDGSLLLKGAGSEQNMPKNIGLRENVLNLIESIRHTVHEACGPTVSCADITNLATKQALMQSRVPGYEVPLGRGDSLGPATEEQVAILPGPDDTIYELVNTFFQRGKFDVSQVVALSGAHTIGRASCESFKNRRGENLDFVQNLHRNCTFPMSPPQDLDVVSPDRFDKQYFVNLQAKKGVLNSDMALTRNSFTNDIVNAFADNEGWFLTSFSEAMRKMAHLDGPPPIIGEIRENCFKVNRKEDTAQGFTASA